MDPAALAGLCAVLAAGGHSGPPPPGVDCPPAAVGSAAMSSETLRFLAEALRAPAAREGIARVAFAEAGNQGDSGLAGVVYAILNRLADGRWGTTVDSVLNARSQFEPVMRAGGDWRGLPAVSAADQARIDTILNLALDGRLPDLTHGARYFQNPVIVARRAADGEVSPRLVNFGGATPSAVIGAHTFYVGAEPGGGGEGRSPRAVVSATPATMFVGEIQSNTEATSTPPPADQATIADVRSASSGDPAQAMFVGPDGVVRDAPP